MDFALAWIALGVALLAFVWEVVDAKDFRRRLDRLESDVASELRKRKDLDRDVSSFSAQAHRLGRETSGATQAIDALYDHLGLELGEEPHRLVVRKRERPVT